MTVAVDHGATRAGRWLREQRLKLAIAIAAVEGALVVFDVVSWWLALAVAAACLAFYLFLGRTSSLATIRHASWVAAASQVMVALVPVLVVVVGTLAVIAVALLALIALVLLLRDRG